MPLQMGISWHVLLSIFMLAQFAGLVSHVPGGLGVFEMVIVLFIVQDVSQAHILGTLLLFRLIYYLFHCQGEHFSCVVVKLEIGYLDCMELIGAEEVGNDQKEGIVFTFV